MHKKATNSEVLTKEILSLAFFTYVFELALRAVLVAALTRDESLHVWYVELECLPMCSSETKMAAGDSPKGHTSPPFVKLPSP